MMHRSLSLATPHGPLHGQLLLPDHPVGLIFHARLQPAPGDALIAAEAERHGCALLDFDLLTAQELHFADAAENVPRLTQRILEILSLITRHEDVSLLPMGALAAGHVTPALLRAAAQRDTQVRAVACQGGLLDRAGRQALELLVAPLYMVFAGDDPHGPAVFDRAAPLLGGPHERYVLRPGEDAASRLCPWLCARLGAPAGA